jgi:DNA invertase Pin-like site-specific DNA recombinase
VIYARYSSENQREASIEDQARVCRARAQSEGWTVTEVYADYALSGATINRPRLQGMVAEARLGKFDVVLAEGLDRISRDQEHTAGIWKTLSFAGVKLITLAEGEITELHVGLKGTMNALFLKDLAAKTHRGIAGRVEAGKSGGGLCYGYDVVRRLDSRGGVIRGERAINDDQATVVRRIFSMFATGSSPIAIAKALNGDHIPGPEGRAWRDTTIRGHALRGTGILRNELYVGKLVWNRMRFVRDPTTGKRVSRQNPEVKWLHKDVPELRIVDAKTWAQVQTRLGAIRTANGADQPDRPRFWEKRRASHLLTHKVFCGFCGSSMTNIGKDYVACSAARKQGVCSTTKGMRRRQLEDLVLEALRSEMMAPAAVAAFTQAFTEEWNRAAANASVGRGASARELATVERKLTGLISALADGFRAPGLQAQLDTLEAKRAALAAELETPAPALPRLHSNLAQVYRGKVERLAEAFQTGPESQEAMDAVRNLVERIVLTPLPTGKGFEIELIGEIAAMIRLGMERPPAVQQGHHANGPGLFESSIKVVAGTRNHLTLLLSG